MEHVISIGPSGLVKAMHNDSFPMGFLGQQSITRASEIMWDDMAQYWSIHFNIAGTFVAPTEEYSGFDSYHEARDFEVAVMNECMKQQLQPTDSAIRSWAAQQKV